MLNRNDEALYSKITILSELINHQSDLGISTLNTLLVSVYSNMYQEENTRFCLHFTKLVISNF